LPTKRKQQKHKVTSTPRSTRNQQKGPPRRFLRRFWPLFVVFSVVIGTFVSFLSLLPDISIIPNTSVDSQDPLQTPFVITNEGLLPIHDVEIKWGMKDKMGSSTQGTIKISGMMWRAEPPIPILYRRESKTYFPSGIIEFKFPVDIGDIFISVSFRPDFILWKQKKNYRFSLVKDKAGKTRWYPKPMSESATIPN